MLHRATIVILAALSLFITACEPRTAEECQGDIEAMREVVEDAVDAGNSCESDGDCIIVDVSNSCEARCPVAVHYADADAVESEVRDGELNYCVGYGEDCGFTAVTCEARYPTCNMGRCEMTAF